MEWNLTTAQAVAGGHLPDLIVREMSKIEFCAAESCCIDFKRDSYGDDALSLANAVKDIASFYNAFGGFIVFGVEEIEKDVRFRVIGIGETPVKMQALRGKCESWLTRSISFSYAEIQITDSLRVGVIHVPKRPASEDPNAFKRRGPEIRPGKIVFDAGDVAVRRDDNSVIAAELRDWQLALGRREIDALGVSLGRLIAEKQSGSALDNNMPSRSVICAKFVGRVDDLTHLWKWLQDDFQYAMVIAGEGGKGKTSLAYEFATQVAYQSPLNISRIVWLTAKKRQFSGIENLWVQMPETHFQCFRTLLVALGQYLALTEEELSSSSDAELRRMIHMAVSLQPTLFVLDDIDSLGLDDQRRALEFAQQAGCRGTRFLLTTRSNASYSRDAAITLSGLEGRDYVDLLEVLATKYGISLGQKDIEQLQEATLGSPLLTDSVLRVMRRGNSLRRAIDEWRGQSGEDARDAILGREVEQLTPEAKRALLCLAFLGECSKTELMSVSGLLEYRLEDALVELQSLFIVSAPKIIESEPRFEISLTAALLVISKRSALATDHVALERAVKQMRERANKGVAQKNNYQVGRAISQALALIKEGERQKAMQTIDAALRHLKNNPDLLLFKARQILDSAHPDFEEARRMLHDAYKYGARKPVLFNLWYQTERTLGFGPGVIDVSVMALKEMPAEEVTWAQRKAEGYVLMGLARHKNREFDQAYVELSSAAKELSFVMGKASGSENSRIRELLYGVHDQLLTVLPKTSPGFQFETLSLIRELTDRGDHRFEVVVLLAEEIIARGHSLGRKAGASDVQRARFERNRDYVVGLLRNKGSRGQELLRRIEGLASSH